MWSYGGGGGGWGHGGGWSGSQDWGKPARTGYRPAYTPPKATGVAAPSAAPAAVRPPSRPVANGVPAASAPPAAVRPPSRPVAAPTPRGANAAAKAANAKPGVQAPPSVVHSLLKEGQRNTAKGTLTKNLAKAAAEAQAQGRATLRPAAPRPEGAAMAAVRAPIKPGLVSGGQGGGGTKRPLETGAQQTAQGAAAAAKAAKAPRIMAARKPGSAKVPKSQRAKQLDDDEEILEEEDGEATLASLVDDWDGTVLSIADIAARDADPLIAKHISGAQAIASAHFDEDYIGEIVRDSGYRLTMLIEDSTAVTGYLVYSYSGGCINVVQIAISESHRGRGLGRCAVAWLLEHAKKAGLASVTIGCTAEGVHFYERCGFKKGSRTPAGFITMCLDVESTETVTPISEKKPKAAAVAPPGQQKPKGQQQQQQQQKQQQQQDQWQQGGQWYQGQWQQGQWTQQEQGQWTQQEQEQWQQQQDQWQQKGKTVPPKREAAPKAAVPPKAGKAGKAGPAAKEGKAGPAAKEGKAGKAGKAVAAPKMRPAAKVGKAIGPKAGVIAPKAGLSKAEAAPKVGDAKAKGKTVPPKARLTPAPKKGDVAPPEEEVVSMSRGALIMKIFDICDADGDKILNEKEMRSYAVCCGFAGTEKDWGKDYRALCVKFSTTPDKGLDMVKFEQVINEGGAGLYSDAELQGVLDKLERDLKTMAENEARMELIKTVFEECDVDKDECLSAKEMRRVVIHIGFTGTDQEWNREYSDMCLDNKRDPALGINFDLFVKLVNDATDAGCYCSLNDLEAVLENKAAAKQPKVVKPPPKRPVLSARASITLGLFKALDVDGDGYLNMAEMQKFAQNIGFKCDDEKWAKEYALFCEQGEVDPAVGIHPKLFTKLVDDRSDAGCYCSEAELKDMLKELNPNAGEISSRGALITAVFKACDRDETGRLDIVKLRAFAGHTGFDGDDDAWEKEYGMLCHEVKAPPEEGVNLAAFTKLVNDTSERGCFCRDVELAAIIRQLGASNFLGGPNGAGGGGGSSLTPVSRNAIIRTIFHLCDQDGNKLLTEGEMRTFAQAAGFDGSQADWAKEYRFVCSRCASDATKGVNPAKFIQVINNGSAGRYSEAELKLILEKLELQACLNAGASGRSGVIRAAFHACDVDSDGYLNRQEMKHIANQVGFKGTNDEWAKEYLGMCRDHGAEPHIGIDLAMLEVLVNDSSESGCYCSDQDLRGVLQSMGEMEGDVVKVASTTNVIRTELIRSVFKACDLDRDGALDEMEMRSFAHHVGFEGTNDEWSREFALLCSEKKVAGVDLLLFEKLVNDNSETGCHCTDQQLQMIFTKLDLGFR